MAKRKCKEVISHNCEHTRWVAVSLSYLYGTKHTVIADIFNVSRKTIDNWVNKFENEGTPAEADVSQKRVLPEGMEKFIETYIQIHPTLYLEELQEQISLHFPSFPKSISSVCRLLRHDLNYTRKVLTKRAREASRNEIQNYYARLAPFYCCPEQLVFVDETSKDGRSSFRKYAYSKKGTPAIVRLPNTRGKRVSILASFTTYGFSSWYISTGTYDRLAFHNAFREKILPTLNPWPFPRSMLVMDNAKIHMYPELETMVNSAGAILFYLPPYCPHLNPIEMGFGQFKKWIQRYANMAFPVAPEAVINVAMKKCTSRRVALNLFKHCGYDYKRLHYPK
jgi:transposase